MFLAAAPLVEGAKGLLCIAPERVSTEPAARYRALRLDFPRRGDRHRLVGTRRTTACMALFAGSLGGCKQPSADAKTEPVPSASAAQPALAASVHSAPMSSIVVDHGELDTVAPTSSPKLVATTIATTIYKLPNRDSRRLGYIRLGGTVPRDPNPVPGKGCKKEWYRVYPMGHVCTDDATIDLNDPLVRATTKRPETDKPLPYSYGFVRATAPQYLKIPSKKQQLASEFKLEEHLAWFAEHQAEVQTVILGANDIPLDARGIAVPGLKHAPGFRPSTERSTNELFSGLPGDGKIPFWLENGRSIPNVSGFEVPEYAVFADRVRRKTGLSFIDAFNTKSEDIQRRFAVTVDMRLIPTTKVKPDTGSPFHGIEIPEGMHLPFAWVNKRDKTTYKLIKGTDEARPAESIPRRAVVPLSGRARIKGGRRYYQTLKDKTRWLLADDLSIVAKPPKWPSYAEKGDKWMDISIRQQTLVLYEGKRPWYATMVSTGRDRFGDPDKSLATPMGEFELQSKHIAAAMDSEENSTVSGGQKSRKQSLDAEGQATVERLKKAVEAGQKLNDEDQRRWANVQKGRHPEYGVTRRRGSANFELRDVPWIQYFAAGYALHGAYWHDVFGIPRSHGCINLAPIDARIAFMWTDPPIPEGWHGINIGHDMGQGTRIYIHE